jgi:hypothetical protein
MISRPFYRDCILYFHIFLAEPLREVSEISRLRHVVILAADVALAVVPSRDALCFAAVFDAAIPARPSWIRSLFFFSFHFFFLVWLVSLFILSILPIFFLFALANRDVQLYNSKSLAIDN